MKAKKQPAPKPEVKTTKKKLKLVSPGELISVAGGQIVAEQC